MHVPKWILTSKLLCLVVAIVFFATVISVSYANEKLVIFDGKQFEIFVDDLTHEAVYELNFTLTLPSSYKNGTFFVEYTNMIGETVVERSVISEVSVFVDGAILLTKKYSPSVQAFSLHKDVLFQEEANHTGRIILFGTSEHKLMGTIDLYVKYTTSGSNGLFNWNLLDFGSNWVFYIILVSSVSFSIAVLLIRRRRRSVEV